MSVDIEQGRALLAAAPDAPWVHDLGEITNQAHGPREFFADTGELDVADLILWLVNNADVLLSEVERLRGAGEGIAAEIEADAKAYRAAWNEPDMVLGMIRAAAVARGWDPAPPARNPDGRGGET